MTPNWFIAFPVAAGDWYAPLVSGVPGGVRRFHPGDLHATLAFLGACGPAAAAAAWETLGDLDHPPVRARLGALRPMGNRKRPSAYAATFTQGRDTLAALIGARRADALAAAGARPDTRSPLPHVTVARPPRRADAPVRAAGLAWMRQQPPVDAAVRIDSLALYTWSDDRRSRLFQLVERRPLGAG